jgi:four helix bundle protein
MILIRTKQLNEELVTKSFAFSLNVLELYISLLKKNEFELSKNLLASGTKIRANIEPPFAVVDKQDFIHSISLAQKEAMEARYWLKMVQMKHFISDSCDDCVDQINEIINILNYMIQENNKYKIKFDLHNLN